MLDLISQALSTQLPMLGLTVVRIDGSYTLQQRRDALDKFNSDDDCVVMLASIGAVGEGYVIFYDFGMICPRERRPFYSTQGEN